MPIFQPAREQADAKRRISKGSELAVRHYEVSECTLLCSQRWMPPTTRELTVEEEHCLYLSRVVALDVAEELA